MTSIWKSYASGLALWTLWCWLMVWRPEPFANATLRAGVRIAVVLLPALWLARKHELSFGLWPINWRAVGIGLAVAVVLLGGNIGLIRPKTLTIPHGFNTYFNFIIGSPIAEELLFRGAIMQLVRKYTRPLTAMLISTLLFVMFHWPQWLILEPLPLNQFLVLSANIFFIGMVLATLYQRSNSLLAPIIYHILNNFVAFLIG
ncbi:MAG TPA: CPBP family intramembrane metalloprotease [Anaerolineae bacterium]|nr:CPBP family intramembrane metalloprotease [Anaerolineae bacterium]